MAETLTEQQRAAVDNRGGTLLVSAAAGSGKTKVLVDRVLSRITREGRNIHEFLIITFTNAAAAELRAKISKAISQRLGQEPDNRHLSRQLGLLHLSQISTVHAFCGALIRQYGYQLEIPTDYRMLDDAERTEMLKKLLDQVLDQAYEAQTPGFLLLTDTLGAGRNDSRLGELTLQLYEKVLSQPDPRRWLMAQDFGLSPEEDLTDSVWGRLLTQHARTRLDWLLERYDWAVEAMEGDEKLMAKYLPCYIAQREDIRRMRQAMVLPWDQIEKQLTLEDPRISVRQYPDPEHLERIKAVRADARTLVKELQGLFSRSAAALIQEQNQLAPALEALRDLVLALDQRFSAEKRRKNLLDFSDQEHLAIRLLTHPESGRPTQVAREVCSRYAEIMVDEYQDSNRVQEVIFRAIAAGDDENRFLVGDVKQSIYGFRTAEPEIFLDKYRRFAPAAEARDPQPRKLVLSKNFRSRPEILEAVNHTFRTVMSETVGQIDYGPDEQLYPGLEDYPQTGRAHVEFHMLELTKLEDDPDEIRYQREADWVAGRIVSLLLEQAPVRDGGGLRPVQPEDVALLFRNRKPIPAFAQALRRANIPVAADSEESLFETPEVAVLVNFLRTLHNPHQDVPLLAVLCSPVFRFSNQQLAQIRAESRQKRFYDAMRESAAPWCVRAVEMLEELRQRAGRESAEKLVWALLQETGLLAAYGAMEQGRARRENLLAIYQFALDQASGGFLYLYPLLRALDRAAQQGTLTARKQSTGVTLTTMHKSKGLEYPVVFLPCLSGEFSQQEMRSPLLYESDLGVAAQITDLAHRVRYNGVAYEALKRKITEDLRSEEMRILYVAMTRPKDYLIMTYADRNPQGRMAKLLPGVGMPAPVWASAQVQRLGDWVLLSALNRAEAGELFALAGRPEIELTVSEYPWRITLERLEGGASAEYRAPTAARETAAPAPSAQTLLSQLHWVDPHQGAEIAPSKLTATQIKGRNLDQEIAEGAAAQARLPQLRRPDFLVEQQGLSPTERGTAVHMFLQYADYTALQTPQGVEQEKLRLEDEAFLTAAQLEAVDPDRIAGMFSSKFGQRMLGAQGLIREFKFSILEDAARYYPDTEGEQVLLQGVVDAAWMEEDGICVLDFKTDRVSQETIQERAEHYRPQLTAYRTALERIFKKPVKAMYLYFLWIGKEVAL